MKNLVLITQVGIDMVVPIFLGLLLGSLLDKWIGTKWIFSIILLIMGVAAGFLSAYKRIMELNKEKNKDKEEKRDRK